jgi:hypothetical protein
MFKRGYILENFMFLNLLFVLSLILLKIDFINATGPVVMISLVMIPQSIIKECREIVNNDKIKKKNEECRKIFNNIRSILKDLAKTEEIQNRKLSKIYNKSYMEMRRY